MAALRPSNPTRAAALQQLTALYRFAEQGGRQGAISTGYGELDRLLPRGGWPLGSIIELLSATTAIGELRLVLPALVRLAEAGRSIVWIAPPYIPYAPALKEHGLPLERILIVAAGSVLESLWAMEQALRCPAIGAVLGWSSHIIDKNLRRLQLAAEAGGSLGILHRPVAAAREASPAAMRLQLQAMPEGLEVHMLKLRGGRAGASWQLPLAEAAEDSTDALAVPSFAGAGA